jgi:hypothetical protein
VLCHFEHRPWALRLLPLAAGVVYLTWTESGIGMWLALGAALAFVLWWTIGWDDRRRERRTEWLRTNHICLHCGYDMRATPRRCPECGLESDS